MNDCHTAARKIVRSPFREEHLVVVPRFFWGIYANLEKMSPFCPMSSHAPPPCRGYWWPMVLAWDNWSILSAYVHKYMVSEARCPPLSHHAPPPVGVIGGQWCWPKTIGPYCLPMYTSIWYLRPSIWHLRQDVPLCPVMPPL